MTLSERITEVIGTDDWVLVHRGHELLDVDDLDRLEATLLEVGRQ